MPVTWVKLVHFRLTYVFQTRAFVLFDEKMHLVHKRTESGREIVFHYFAKFQKLQYFYTSSFRIYYIQIFSFSIGLSQTPTIIYDFQSVYGSLMAHLTDIVWWREAVHLGAWARIHIIQISISVHCFADPSKGKVLLLV